jgi:transposase
MVLLKTIVMRMEIVYLQVIEVGCGIDEHKDVIVATIRKSSKDYQTRELSSFKSSLKDIKDWCKEEKVTHIAIESTGNY